MKKLQNNFTTPEQSKRLLESGVPADSADCVLVRNLYFPIGEYEIKVLNGKYSRFIEMHDTWEILPCWSVGRLLEIEKICTKIPMMIEYGSIDKVVKYLEIRINDYDFSKLEE